MEATWLTMVGDVEKVAFVLMTPKLTMETQRTRSRSWRERDSRKDRRYAAWSASMALPGGLERATRREWLRCMAGVVMASMVGNLEKAAAENVESVQVKFMKEGPNDGPQPQVGDLVGIRFRASYNGRTFDDNFDKTEPLFIRVGSGNVIQVCAGNISLGAVWFDDND